MNGLQLEHVLNLLLNFSHLGPLLLDLLLLALLLSPVQLVVIKTPFSQVAVSLVSILGLPFYRGVTRARLTAAAQATLVAMIDVKSAGRFFPFALRAEIKLHKAPPCFELPKRKCAKPKKLLELFRNRELLCALNSFRVVDIHDNRLAPVGRIEAFDRIAGSIHGHRFARDGFLLHLLRCKCFIFTNESELIHGHQENSLNDFLRSAKPLVKQIISLFVLPRYGSPHDFHKESR